MHGSEQTSEERKHSRVQSERDQSRQDNLQGDSYACLVSKSLATGA